MWAGCDVGELFVFSYEKKIVENKVNTLKWQISFLLPPLESSNKKTVNFFKILFFFTVSIQCNCELFKVDVLFFENPLTIQIPLSEI